MTDTEAKTIEQIGKVAKDASRVLNKTKFSFFPTELLHPEDPTLVAVRSMFFSADGLLMSIEDIIEDSPHLKKSGRKNNKNNKNKKKGKK